MTLIEEAFAMLEDLKGQDERTDEIIEEALKRIQADVEALAYDLQEIDQEHEKLKLEYEAFKVTSATELERERIRAAQPQVRWYQR